MRIVDKREQSRDIPAPEIFSSIIQEIPSNLKRGIKELVLLDRDYHEHGGALARYIEVEGTHAAEIEVYVGDFLEYPETLQQDEFFLTWNFSLILMHEVYHHMVRGLHERKKPSDKHEELEADQWAKTEATKIFRAIFPPSRLGKKHREAREFLEKMEKGIFVWTKK
jgi:hypothetical protein